MKDKWAELAGEIDGESIRRVDGMLRRYAVRPPSPGCQAAATEAALTAMERRRAGRWHSLWEQVKVEARFIPLWYYLASAALAVAGACLLLASPDMANRIGIVAGMAPLPALLGLMELFHGSDAGMAEIERACRYSPARVLSARMLIIGALSTVLCALLGFCSRFGSAWMSAGLVVTPFCLSAAAGLIFSSAPRSGSGSVQVALAVAFANGAVALLAYNRFKWLVAAAPAFWLITMALSAVILLAAARGTLACAATLYERKLLEWN